VSLSTSEAEYVAASQCGQEVYYMREILRDFGYAPTAPTHIYEGPVSPYPKILFVASSPATLISSVTLFAIWWPQASSNLCLYVPISW
jgi:hypothetical protein